MKRFRLIQLLLFVVLFSGLAEAQGAGQRRSDFLWDTHGSLLATFSFREIIDAEIRSKLKRGLPTRIILTGILHRADDDTPIAATYQNCKITWHVWEEMYRVEIATPARATPKRHWTPTLAGVLRRCAEATKLLVANITQLTKGTAVYLRAQVLINPLSDTLIQKLKHWLNRPARSTTASPGSALFSTFTGLFMQRIGTAEQTLRFRTTALTPRTLRK